MHPQVGFSAFLTPLLPRAETASSAWLQTMPLRTDGCMAKLTTGAMPWDNACIESFHALIKREWLNRFKILDYDHAYKLIFQYIETFYNTVRIHSHCGYLSPNEYEENYKKRLDAIELVA